MKICAVVSEFNPFHNGHKYLFEQIRKKGYNAIICVMSGNFVQRGELALLDKKIRAKNAIDGGADLVVSNPFPWSCAGAELFARGAVSVLCSLGGVQAIAFGSECADLKLLSECAMYLSEITPTQIKEAQKENPKLSYAQVRQKMLLQKAGENTAKLLECPNDILAVEYLKALKFLKSDIVPVPIKREASSHDGTVYSEKICSSSHIRGLIESDNLEGITDFVPWDLSLVRDNMRLVDKEKYFNYLRGAILSKEPSELSYLAENGGGFEYAVYREMLVSKDYESLLASLSARHLTDAKIRRALLFLALGVKKDVFTGLPEYTEILASSKVGNELLASFRKSAEITILSKTANIKNASEEAKKQFKLQRKAEIAFETLLK